MTDVNPPVDDSNVSAARDPAARADLLLVDNDATIRELVGWVLTRGGYCVRQAASFAEARAHLAERQPDLLLSDVDLGVESALVELPRLAAESLLPPTLVVSGFLDADKRRALSALVEVIGFLDKPFDPRGLEHEVEVALNVVRERRASAQVSAAPRREQSSGGIAVDGPRAANGDEVHDQHSAGSAAREERVESEDDDGWIEIGGAP